METRQFPFTKQDIINELNNKWNDGVVSIECGECRNGCGSSATHAFYYVRLNWVEFQDGGKYRTAYEFAKAVQDVLVKMESEFAKDNVLFVKHIESYISGKDYMWNCNKYDDIECVTKIVKIIPCNTFIELQKFLKDKAGFDLNITKWRESALCQKRNSKSYSNTFYYGKSEGCSKKALERLKAEYKSGNKIVAELKGEEIFDGGYDRNRFEYEQYGLYQVKLHITISTPTGRNERHIIL